MARSCGVGQSGEPAVLAAVDFAPRPECSAVFSSHISLPQRRIEGSHRRDSTRHHDSESFHGCLSEAGCAGEAGGAWRDRRQEVQLDQGAVTYCEMSYPPSETRDETEA